MSTFLHKMSYQDLFSFAAVYSLALKSTLGHFRSCTIAFVLTFVVIVLSRDEYKAI